MKKIYIIAASVVFLLFICVLVSIRLYEDYSFNGVEEVYTIKTNYSYNTTNNNRIEVLCYSNDPKSFLKEYNDVQATFSSKDYILSATIEDVSRVSTHSYKDERYYGYKLYIRPEGISFTHGFEDCILKTRDFEVEIGHLSVVTLKSKNSYLDFSKIYAIANESLGYKSINGFVITFKNSGNTPIYITEIFLGYYNFADLSRAHKLDNDINYGDDITKYITDYSPLKYSKTDGTIVVGANTSVKYLIPVYYSDKSFLGNTLMYINDTMYIDNSNYITNYDDIDIYKGIIIEAKLSNS